MQPLMLVVGFVLLTAAFWVLESLWPGVPAQPKLRRGVGTDTIYWFFSALVTKSVSLLAVLIAVAPLLLLLGYEWEDEAIRDAVHGGRPPLVWLPIWAQIVLVLVVGDLIGYWSHRWFHGRLLWPLHAVHHSSKQLDWLSSVRNHPLNDLGTRLGQTVPFVALGLSPAVVAAYLPLLTLHAIFVHSNVSWTFGPLRYALASPAFHRWHHSREAEAINKNFASLFPVFDLLFGTFYMPPGGQPSEFGVQGDDVPEGFLDQMVYPFQPTAPSERG